MSKAILVIDMPESCGKCPICSSYEIISSINEYWCGVKNREVDKSNKPDWCPLQPAPEYQDIWYDDESSDWERGYNNCLREIMGRTEE